MQPLQPEQNPDDCQATWPISRTGCRHTITRDSLARVMHAGIWQQTDGNVYLMYPSTYVGIQHLHAQARRMGSVAL